MKNRFLSKLAVGILIAGCSTDSLRNSDDPEVIYNGALDTIKRERYLEADELLKEIRTRFPQSRFAALAEVRGGDILFSQENFVEAAATYGAFVELYPRHPEADYALYRRALAFLSDAPEDVSRDQAPAAEAIKAGQALKARYPQSKYVEEVRSIVSQARLRLAQKEAYIARFYERRDQPLAARRRWQNIKMMYPEVSEVPGGAALLEEANASIEKLGAKVGQDPLGKP